MKEIIANNVKETINDMSKWRPNEPCLYVIPDLNGNIDILNKVLARILPLRKSEGIIDRIVFLGDYMDRNINSCLVLDRLIEIDKLHPNQIIFLHGNHESILLKTIDAEPGQKQSASSLHTNYSMWMNNGGLQTLTGYLQRAGVDTPAVSLPRYRIIDFVPISHIEFLQTKLVNYYETEDYIFVHGGCIPDKPLKEQEPEALWWDRSLCKFVKDCINNNKQDQINWPKTIVTGHNASLMPIVHEKFLMLDISANKKELLVVELNSFTAMAAHVDKDRLVAYELKETEPQKVTFKRVT